MTYTYIFLQLKNTEENHLRRFEDYESTVEHFGGVDLDRYVSADAGLVEADSATEACENLFWKYNRDERPDGYTGRSMSVSDVVILLDDSVEPPEESKWFCDSIGFKRLEV